MVEFREIPVGKQFYLNGSWYTKRSSRTALLEGLGRIFYIKLNTLCEKVAKWKQLKYWT